MNYGRALTRRRVAASLMLGVVIALGCQKPAVEPVSQAPAVGEKPTAIEPTPDRPIEPQQPEPTPPTQEPPAQVDETTPEPNTAPPAEPLPEAPATTPDQAEIDRLKAELEKQVGAKELTPEERALAEEEDALNLLLPIRAQPKPIPAPPLEGGVGWLNTAGPIDIKDLKGKFVILDFWTYCCINCIHILPELKKLEKKYPNELVVIGVHSKKFEEEGESKNIEEAVLRYEIEHPVVNDANHTIWDNYYVQAWPTMYMVDPLGNVVWGTSGEVTVEDLEKLLKPAIAFYKKKKLLDETPVRFDLAAYQASQTPLRFPGKVVADEAGGRLFISDSNHNRIIITDLAGKLLHVIGKGTIGSADGDFATAQFDHPQGVHLHQDTLYVADTENHLLRKVDLKSQQVTTIAGAGGQSRERLMGLNLVTWQGDEPKKTPLNSPWDLWVHDGWLYIAMAGPHQIWRMSLDEKSIGIYAGSGQEDIKDGPLVAGKAPADRESFLGLAAFAQPSGFSSDGKSLFVADSEGSSIRAVPLSGEGEVSTPIGTAHLSQGRLFANGDVDGESPNARLQHALGVAYHRDLLYVADTYNNKVKVVDLAKQTSQTLVGSGKSGHTDDPPTFNEPAGISAAGGKLYIADTNNHLIRVVNLDDGNKVTTLAIAGLEPPPKEAPAAEIAPALTTPAIEVAAAKVKPIAGQVTLAVKLTLPDGYKINPLAPMRYKLTAEGDAGAIDRSKLPAAGVKVDPPATEFTVQVPVAAEPGEDTLKISLTYYYCREGAEGLCKTGHANWVAKFTTAADATEEKIPLTLKVE